MKMPELPPIATALGRLRQKRPAPRTWPFAPLPDELRHVAQETTPSNDFLVTILAPELLPGASGPAPFPPCPIPEPEAARSTYWFDL